jgi:hypothetical protein
LMLEPPFFEGNTEHRVRGGDAERAQHPFGFYALVRRAFLEGGSSAYSASLSSDARCSS